MLLSIKKVVLAFLLISVLAGCATSEQINNNATGRYTQFIDEAKEKNLLDNTSHTAQRIHRIFQKIRPFADKENTTGIKFDWQLNVLKSDELNAWAMPGGKMVVYTGLVDRLNLNDHEIATVMGHEMAHVLKEHGKNQQNFQQATSIFTNVLSAAVQIAVFKSYNSSSTELLGAVKDLAVDRPYSRSIEMEADSIGLMLMAKSGFDPRHAPNLWIKMQQSGAASQGILVALLSTHPTDNARLENLQHLMPQALKLYTESSR